MIYFQELLRETFYKIPRWKERDKKKRFVPLQNFDFTKKSEEKEIDPSRASEVLHFLLGRLPRADRLVLTLMYFENCSTREIADRMGRSRASVKMRALRAREKVKKIAERENLLEKLEWIQ